MFPQVRNELLTVSKRLAANSAFEENHTRVLTLVVLQRCVRPEPLWAVAALEQLGLLMAIQVTVEIQRQLELLGAQRALVLVLVGVGEQVGPERFPRLEPLGTHGALEESLRGVDE